MNALTFLESSAPYSRSTTECLEAVRTILEMYGEEPIKIRLIHQLCDGWLRTGTTDAPALGDTPVDAGALGGKAFHGYADEALPIAFAASTSNTMRDAKVSAASPEAGRANLKRKRTRVH